MREENTHFRLSQFRQDVPEKSIRARAYIRPERIFLFTNKKRKCISRRQLDTSIFTHFEYTVATINLWMKKTCRNSPIRPTRFPFPRRQQTDQYNSWKKKKKTFAYVAAHPLSFSASAALHTQELNLNIAWMDGIVWIALPIKSAATNVLNGFKMSFRYVFFFRPYLDDRTAIEVCCLSLLFLIAHMPRIKHLLFIFIVVSYNFTTCLNIIIIYTLRGWTFHAKSKLHIFSL